MATLHPTVAAVTTTFLILPCLAVLLRTYVRVLLVRSFGADDWFMVLALLLHAALAVTLYAMGANRLGYHTDQGNVLEVLKWWVVCELVYDIETAIIKVSIGLLLLRLVVKRYQIWMIRSVIGFTCLYCFILFFVVLFQCSPPDKFWNPTKEGHCLPQYVVINGAYMHTATLVAADLILAAIPAVLLWNANMTRGKKAVVGSILVIGSLGCICGMIRFDTVNQLNFTKDFLYDATGVAYWSYIEAATGIIAGSLVTLRPLFSSWQQRSTKGSSYAKRPTASKESQIITIGGTGDQSNRRRKSEEIGGEIGFGSTENLREASPDIELHVYGKDAK